MPVVPHPEWSKLKFSVKRKAYPAVTRFVDTLRELHSIGEACFATFGFPAEAAFWTAAGRDELLESGFFDRFWRTAAVKRALPQLAAPSGFTCRTPFARGNPFTLDGEFASAIYSGGVYSRYTGTPADAKAEAIAPAAELLGEQFDRTQVYTNHAEWCGYFGGMVDWSWVVVDNRAALIQVLCATDFI